MADDSAAPSGPEPTSSPLSPCPPPMRPAGPEMTIPSGIPGGARVETLPPGQPLWLGLPAMPGVLWRGPQEPRAMPVQIPTGYPAQTPPQFVEAPTPVPTQAELMRRKTAQLAAAPPTADQASHDRDRKVAALRAATPPAGQIPATSPSQRQQPALAPATKILGILSGPDFWAGVRRQLSPQGTSPQQTPALPQYSSSVSATSPLILRRAVPVSPAIAGTPSPTPPLGAPLRLHQMGINYIGMEPFVRALANGGLSGMFRRTAEHSPWGRGAVSVSQGVPGSVKATRGGNRKSGPGWFGYDYEFTAPPGTRIIQHIRWEYSFYCYPPGSKDSHPPFASLAQDFWEWWIIGPTGSVVDTHGTAVGPLGLNAFEWGFLKTMNRERTWLINVLRNKYMHACGRGLPCECFEVKFKLACRVYLGTVYLEGDDYGTDRDGSQFGFGRTADDAAWLQWTFYDADGRPSPQDPEDDDYHSKPHLVVPHPPPIYELEQSGTLFGGDSAPDSTDGNIREVVPVVPFPSPPPKPEQAEYHPPR